MQTRTRESGQIIVIFALALVAMVAMVGLILDGGSTFGQRRVEQNAADLAALAGATVQINGGTTTEVEAKAWEVAKNNHYDDADPNTVVTVTQAPGTVKVDITAPHKNYFSSVVGISTWDVSVTATAAVGIPTGITGAAPIIFSIQDFDPNTGLPYSDYGCVTPTCTAAGFGDGNGDVPNGPNDIAWTLYGPNVNTNSVRPYLAGTNLTSPSFNLNDYIGQSNGGFHNALFGSGTGIANPSQCDGGSAHTNVDTCLSGTDVVVPIVSPVGTTCNPGTGGTTGGGGCFEGWALFHVVSADGANSKTIQGYFVSGFSRNADGATLCTPGTAGCVFHGLYGLKLVN